MRRHRVVERPPIHQFRRVFEVQPGEPHTEDSFARLTNEIFLWCEEEFGGRFLGRWSQQPRVFPDGSHSQVYAFAQEDDAFAFKMRWG